MAIITCVECGKEISDRAAACLHCGCPIEYSKAQQSTPAAAVVTAQSKIAGNDTVRKALLRDYLERVRTLETDIYTMGELLKTLSPLSKPYPEKQEIKEPYKPSPPNPGSRVPYLMSSAGYDPNRAAREAYRKDRKYMGLDRLNPLFLYDSIKKASDTKKAAEKERDKWEHDCEVANRKYEEDTKHYHEVELPRYEERMREYKIKVAEEEKRHESACLEVKQFNQSLEHQIATVRAEKINTEKALASLYNTGIIFPKYRGIIPVTMFCEYMDSGRRTELEGVHGMYDLYESELLAKQIVNELGKINSNLYNVNYQLGSISSQLSGIARNQIMLHEEIARGNAISQKISQDTRTLLERSAALQASANHMSSDIQAIRSASQQSVKNTALAAYNAEVTKRRVDAIAKIEEYEFSLRHPTFPGI